MDRGDQHDNLSSFIPAIQGLKVLDTIVLKIKSDNERTFMFLLYIFRL